MAPSSVGFSRSGALANVNTPVAATILNLAESAPPVMLYVRPEPSVSPSGSVDATSVTDVWFSAAFTAAVAPPPSEVIVGASFTFVTVTVMSWTSVRLPLSVTVTCTR